MTGTYRNCCQFLSVIGCLAKIRADLIPFSKNTHCLTWKETRKGEIIFQLLWESLVLANKRNESISYYMENLSEISKMKFNDILRYWMNLIPQLSISYELYGPVETGSFRPTFRPATKNQPNKFQNNFFVLVYCSPISPTFGNTNVSKLKQLIFLYVSLSRLFNTILFYIVYSSPKIFLNLIIKYKTLIASWKLKRKTYNYFHSIKNFAEFSFI